MPPSAPIVMRAGHYVVHVNGRSMLAEAMQAMAAVLLPTQSVVNTERSDDTSAALEQFERTMSLIRAASGQTLTPGGASKGFAMQDGRICRTCCGIRRSTATVSPTRPISRPSRALSLIGLRIARTSHLSLMNQKRIFLSGEPKTYEMIDYCGSRDQMRLPQLLATPRLRRRRSNNDCDQSVCNMTDGTGELRSLASLGPAGVIMVGRAPTAMMPMRNGKSHR